MSATVAGFRARFPQFTDPPYSDDLIDQIMLEAIRLVDPDCFGDRTDDAICYLTAHLLVSTSPGRGDGVQSVTAGSSSITYGAIAADATSLESTQFGKHYLFLCHLCGPAARALC